MSDAVHSKKVTLQNTEQLSRQAYSEHCQTFKMKRFAKKEQIHCSNGPPILRLTQKSTIFFVASMEAKNQLDTSFSF